MQLIELNKLLKEKPELRDEIISRLCIGVEEDTTVTDKLAREGKELLVTQTFNSAISIGYSALSSFLWEPIARAIMDATYEATLLVGILKTADAKMNGKKQPKVLFTKIRGGVFQNKDSWIQDSIASAVKNAPWRYGVGLDIRIVHFGRIDEGYKKLDEIG